MYRQIIISPHEEEINKMIEEISMRVFLKATPYASGYRTDLEIEMTPDFFYKNLYSHSEAANDYISDLCKRMSRDLCKNIILYGYQGCGKTTFIHYMLRELGNIGYRNILINFDAYVDKGNEIKHELVAHLYRAIMNDMTGRDDKVGMYQLNGTKCAVSNKFCEIYNSPENRRIISENFDSWNTYVWLFDKLEYTKILYTSTAEQLNISQKEYEFKLHDYPENDLKVHISKFDINQLMIVIVLWDIAYSLAFQKKNRCCMVFENLDTIYNASALPDFTKQILYFRNNIDSILANIIYEGASLSKMHALYTLIFVMRETTKCEFVDHFVGKVEMYIPTKSMSFLYDMKDIVKQRNLYLHKLECYLLNEGRDISKLKKLEQEIDSVEELLTDPYIANRMFNLFNRSFRVGVEVLSEIIFCSPDTFKDAVHVKNMTQNNDWSMFASRCILFRQVYNKFNAEGYFSIMKNSEYHVEVNHRDYAVNLSRYILLYLNNRQDITKTEEEKENNMVSLDDLFKALLSICEDRNLIINSLWSMYEMRKKQFWGHLITFDDMLTLSKEALDEQLGWVVSGEKNKPYGKVRITTAGFAYLDVLLPHYEYFAARRFDFKSKSLFAYTLDELLMSSPDKSVSMLTYILSEVRQEVRNCSYKLSRFYKYVLCPKDEYYYKNFLDSEFAWKRISKTNGTVVKMLHGERIINSHIGYLDKLRFYCFQLIDDMAREGHLEVNADITHLIRCVMKIQGFKKNFPNIYKIFRDDTESFLILSGGVMDNLTGKIMQGRQKIAVFDEEKQKFFGEIPLDEIAICLKTAFNFIIVDGIKKYIKMFNLINYDDSIASAESMYLISCYSACIFENIEKKQYMDFTTSICRKTGAKIIKKRIKNKEITHRTHYGREMLGNNKRDSKC